MAIKTIYKPRAAIYIGADDGVNKFGHVSSITMRGNLLFIRIFRIINLVVIYEVYFFHLCTLLIGIENYFLSYTCRKLNFRVYICTRRITLDGLRDTVQYVKLFSRIKFTKNKIISSTI